MAFSLPTCCTPIKFFVIVLSGFSRCRGRNEHPFLMNNTGFIGVVGVIISKSFVFLKELEQLSFNLFR